MKKIWMGTLLIVLAVIAGVFIVTQTKKESKEIKIGVILPLTGDAAKYGDWTKKGMEIALEEAKTEYPRHILRLIFEDDEGKPEKAVSAFNKLSKVDRVSVITGVIQSPTALALAPIFEKERIVMLSTGASAEKLKDAGDYIFRIREGSKIHGEKAAQFALSLSNESGVIFLNAENGISYADEYKRYYERNGGKIKIWEAYNERENDFRSYLIKIKEKNLKVIYIPGLATEIASFLKQAKEMGIESTFISSVGAQNPKLIEIAKEAANGLIYSYPAFDPSFKDDSVKIKIFVDKYRDEYGYEPDFLAANGYDAIKLLTLVIEENGYSADEIKNGLYKIRDYDGVGGKISFDQYGEAIKQVILKIIRDQKFEIMR